MRIHKFGDIQEVETVLQGLMEKQSPMVQKLPRQVGRKEGRYMHLLSGEPQIQEPEHTEEAATIQVRTENERIAHLEHDVESLRRDLQALRQAFHDLKSQFE